MEILRISGHFLDFSTRKFVQSSHKIEIFKLCKSQNLLGVHLQTNSRTEHKHKIFPQSMCNIITHQLLTNLLFSTYKK